jgi:predicted glycogen debranching enzyme
MSMTDRITLHRMAWERTEAQAGPDNLLDREWLLTNGLGGYASGTVGGACTRRFHGLLVAALAAPHGRVMMLNHLAEEVRLPDGSVLKLGGDEQEEGVVSMPGARVLAEFRLELGLPVWRFELGDYVLEKRIVVARHQNTVFIRYHLASGQQPIRLRLRPSVHFRPHGGRVDAALEAGYPVVCSEDRCEIRGYEAVPLRLRARGHAVALVLDGGRFREIFYRREARRGYDAQGRLWSPGYFRGDLHPHHDMVLVASTESWENLLALSAGDAWDAELRRRHRLVESAHPEARTGFGAELVLAADQFLVIPATRRSDSARARAAGEVAVTMIAGYPWFTDWGRDSMISLEGLALLTGRSAEGSDILRTFSEHIRDGLIPNHFPEGSEEGIYNTVDASLWFFHALHVYTEATQDRQLLRGLQGQLRHIIEAHLRGTRFGIRMDPGDGLLTQGEAGVALTWMDARLGDWVVTPRRGKAVEINALWYNALRLMEKWAREESGEAAARPLRERAEQVAESFNRRFWIRDRKHLLDVVDGENGDDASFRPNQILAVSLPYPVLDPDRWAPVLQAVKQRLLTPLGLRTLAPGEPEYRATYDGDLRARDAAYHQGTVWPWLMGPFIDAWLRVHPEDRAVARQFLEGFVPHLGDACVGSISEIFDAERPFTARGCVAQAWSVAEVLRAWIKTAPPRP